MRRTATGLVVLVAALLALYGCKQDDPVKRPKIPAEYVLPPANDPRFSKYPTFPDNTLNKWPKKDSIADPDAPPKAPSHFGGAGGGAGGPGM